VTGAVMGAIVHGSFSPVFSIRDGGLLIVITLSGNSDDGKTSTSGS